MVDLNGKVVLVTGGGTGVGRAIVHALADEGCRVVAIGRRREKLEETVAAYAGTGSIAVRALDVSARKDVDELVSGVQSEFGPIDILVNNAGVNVRDRSLEKLSPDDWDYLIRVNLTGAFLMTRAVLPSMRQRRDGLIVNISSIAGKRASTLGGPAYSASKFGMTALAGVVGLEEAGEYGVEFCQFALKIFEDVVLKNKDYVRLRLAPRPVATGGSLALRRCSCRFLNL